MSHFRSARDRGALVFLSAAVVALLAAYVAKPGLVLRLAFDGKTFRGAFGRNRGEVVLRDPKFNAIRITYAPSADSPNVSVACDSGCKLGKAEKRSWPRRWAVTGDLYTDRFVTPDKEIRFPLEVSAPEFSISFDLDGVSERFVEIELLGPTKSSASVRWGFFSHNLILAAPGAFLDVAPGFNVPYYLRYFLHFFLLCAGLGLLFAAGAQFWANFARPEEERTKRPFLAPVAVAVLVAFVAQVALNWISLGGFAHVPDSAGYLIFAKWLAAGHWSFPAPSHAWAGLPVMTDVARGVWYPGYPIGWPAILSLFVLLGVPWCANAALAAGTTFLSADAARRMFGARTGVVTAWLVALSPGILVMGGDYMSHGASIFFLALTNWCAVRFLEAPRRLYAVATGVALGYVATVRPYTGLLVAPGVALPLLMGVRALDRRRALRLAGLFVLGGLVGVSLYLAHNVAMFGLSGRVATSANGSPTIRMSPEGINWGSLLGLLVDVPVQILGWGWTAFGGAVWIWVPLALLGFAIVRKPRDWRNGWLLSYFFLLWIGYGLTAYNGIQGYGPRYVSEAFPFLLVLCARGIDELLQAFPEEAFHRWAIFRPPILLRLALLVAFSFALAGMPARIAVHSNRAHLALDVCEGIAKVPDEKFVLNLSQQWQGWSEVLPCETPGVSRRVIFTQTLDSCRLRQQFPDLPHYEVSPSHQVVPSAPPKCATKEGASS